MLEHFVKCWRKKYCNIFEKYWNIFKFNSHEVGSLEYKKHHLDGFWWAGSSYVYRSSESYTGGPRLPPLPPVHHRISFRPTPPPLCRPRGSMTPFCMIISMYYKVATCPHLNFLYSTSRHWLSPTWVLLTPPGVDVVSIAELRSSDPSPCRLVMFLEIPESLSFVEVVFSLKQYKSCEGTRYSGIIPSEGRWTTQRLKLRSSLVLDNQIPKYRSYILTAPFANFRSLVGLPKLRGWLDFHRFPQHSVHSDCRWTP
jgi:hypothetical protein